MIKEKLDNLQMDVDIWFPYECHRGCGTNVWPYLPLGDVVLPRGPWGCTLDYLPWFY